MLKSLDKTTKLVGGLIIGVVVIITILSGLTHSGGNNTSLVGFSNEVAASDNKVEALTVLTANLNVVEDQNKQLQQQFQQLSTQQQQDIQTLKSQWERQQKTLMAQLAKQPAQTEQTPSNRHDDPALAAENTDYVDDGQDNSMQVIGDAHTLISADSVSWHWVSDLSQAPLTVSNVSDDNSTVGAPAETSGHVEQAATGQAAQAVTVTPVYTIPVNATLTGALLMTPLIARIPIDGDLTDPYPFKAVLSARNLTANGYRLPGIKGAVVSGFSRGDLLKRCARGSITSITFIFTDGSIVTQQVGDEHGSLGYLSLPDGNPCLPGEYHSNAAFVLGSNASLSFAQGYAKAMANSSYLNPSNAVEGGIRQLMTTSTKSAVGEGLAAATSDTQQWWQRRIDNSFDFIWVANWLPDQQRAREVVINITEQINIDHSSNARKVSYDKPINHQDSPLD